MLLFPRNRMSAVSPRLAALITSVRLTAFVASVTPAALAALLVLVPPPARAGSGAADSSAAAAVIALESARAQAVLAADTTALGRMTATEFVEITRLGTLRTRADNLADVGSGMLKLTRVDHDSLAVHVYGDVAVLRGIAINAGTFHGMPFTGRLRYTRVFVHRDGRWQAVLMQQTVMP